MFVLHVLSSRTKLRIRESNSSLLNSTLAQEEPVLSFRRVISLTRTEAERRMIARCGDKPSEGNRFDALSFAPRSLLAIAEEGGGESGTGLSLGTGVEVAEQG